MTKRLLSAALCAGYMFAVIPAMAAPNDIPQGKRDDAAMTYTEHQIAAQRKDNHEANRNVDMLITNRK